MIRGRIFTLREAMETVDAILDNPHFGEDFKHKPVHYEHDSRFANKNLIVPAKRFRRKGNGRPYRLTGADKAVLKGFGYPETDFGQIEQAANRGTFVLNDETPVVFPKYVIVDGEDLERTTTSPRRTPAHTSAKSSKATARSPKTTTN